MSIVLSLVSSRMAGWRGPSKAFALKFKWVKLVKYLISGGMGPDRERRERSSEVI